MDTTLAIWLLPSVESHGWFSQQIRQLSARYQPPDFDPHLTVHTGPAGAVASESSVLGELAVTGHPLRLRVKGVGHWESYTKCLFVEFHLTEELIALAGLLKERIPSDYVLQPHVSLLYHTLPAAERDALAREIVPPFEDVTFVAMEAVLCPAQTKSAADVLRWNSVEQRRLL